MISNNQKLVVEWQIHGANNDWLAAPGYKHDVHTLLRAQAQPHASHCVSFSSFFSDAHQPYGQVTIIHQSQQFRSLGTIPPIQFPSLWWRRDVKSL